MSRFALVVAAVALSVAPALGPAPAQAYSQTESAYYDAFGDLDGIDAASRTQVQINHLGGLRMKTVGPTATQTWTTKADFEDPAFVPADPLLAGRTLLATAAGDLTLRSTPWAMQRLVDAGGVPYVLRAPAAAVGDNFSVGGMSVARVDLGAVTPTDATLPVIPAAKYYLYYTGVPEDEFAQKIYLATSGNGWDWTRWVDVDGVPIPVLELGPAGAFDSRQLGKPWVVYDAADTEAPFRMWYTAEGDFGGGIGYAESTDGVVWSKHKEPADPADPLTLRPVPVLAPGRPGQADSYAVSQPCVVVEKDGLGAISGHKMWYTANDGNNLRVGFASSADGIVWQRGGVVVDITNSNNQSIREGAWSPSVLRRDDGTYAMALTGFKNTGGARQSSIVAGTSPDGLVWSLRSKELIAQQGAAIDPNDFAGFNVSQPALLHEADAPAGERYKLWFVGNNPDDNGNYHDRIGFAYDGPDFTDITDASRHDGPAGDPAWLSVFWLGDQSTDFDSMHVADLRAVSDGATLVGFYAGTNAADFVERIGTKVSTDGGLTWEDGPTAGNALIGRGPAGEFDDGGVASPSPVWDAARNGGAGGWLLYHTALSAAGAPVIALHTATADLTVAPERVAAPVLGAGSGFDAGGCADPFAVVSGADVILFYAGRSGEVWSIGRATAALAAPTSFTRSATAVLSPGEPYDVQGLRDPVVLQHEGTWYLWYTAVGSDGVERVALATSTDGVSFAKQGLALNPSTDAYDIAERGIRPADARYDAAGARLLFSYTGVDRFGWKRVGLAGSTGAGYLQDGTATFELAHDPTGVEPQGDWRKITWAAALPSASTTAEVWVSYYPTVMGLWSGFFPVASAQDLPFGLEVERMRWQVRLKSVDPAATPVISQLDVQHAPIRFAATAQALTVPIVPAAGWYLQSWGTLTLETDLQAPQGGSLTLEVRDQDNTPLVPAQPLATGITTPPIDLSAIPVTSGGLRLLFTFTPDTATCPPKSPLVRNLTATFASTDSGAALTLVATPSKLVSGGSVTLTGTLTGLPKGADPVALDGQSVALKFRTTSQTAWTPLQTVTTAGGGFTVAVKPADSTIYRAEWVPAGPVGGVAYPPAVASAQVLVAPKVTVGVAGFTGRAGQYYVYPFGKLVTVKGRVVPAIYPGSVVVKVQRLAAGKWADHVASRRALTTAGAFAWGWRPKAAGNYRLSARFPGDAAHPARTSPYRYVQVK